MSETTAFLIPAGETTIIASTYYLCRRDACGNETFRVQFDGSEHIKTTCPQCCKEFWIDIYSFFDIASSGFDFYGTSLFCKECTDSRLSGKGFAKVHHDLE